MLFKLILFVLLFIAVSDQEVSDPGYDFFYYYHGNSSMIFSIKLQNLLRSHFNEKYCFLGVGLDSAEDAQQVSALKEQVRQSLENGNCLKYVCHILPFKNY
jgi:hypothetical protein